ncbi:ubiquinol-cytochrome-c reductase complex assembly factor 1 [Frankliniella occidentalis]|uniref:Ubiquinol-cytochrome-c reductase complex assembly factor 1 n=1 Tax=Frankliniella occidentalis TaxID=133901 RepID=A0A6J1S0D5_FRAOC|nr:ubiquinol-cytochrome-c reductase complex assembly factor 1 [Frankliniella occidentalis]
MKMISRPTLNVLRLLTPAHQYLFNPFLMEKYCAPILVNKIQAKLLSSQPLETIKDTWLSTKMMNTRLRLGMAPRPNPYYRLRGLILFQGVEAVNWKDYFKIFQMEDTFHSWFLVIELHMWMLNVRIAREKKEGDMIKKYSMEHMWDAAQARAKKLESYAPSAMQDGFEALHEELIAAFLLYDHGLLTSDVELAGALYFRFLQEKCDDPEKLEILVKHVRNQIHLLDDSSKEEIVDRANVKWLPISEKL